MSTIEIEVTAEDIDAALSEGYNECSCPVARAMKRAGFIRPEVTDEKLSWSSLDDQYEYFSAYAPSSVAAFVIDIDMGRPVTPFKFMLKVSKR